MRVIYYKPWEPTSQEVEEYKLGWKNSDIVHVVASAIASAGIGIISYSFTGSIANASFIGLFSSGIILRLLENIRLESE